MFDPRAPEAGSDGSAALHLKPRWPWPPLPGQADALASPTADDISPHLADLLPMGAAWRTPDGAAFDWASRMGGLLRGFAGALATLYARLFGIAAESTASTLVDGLADWEIEFGLPDVCAGLDATREGRVRALLAKVRSTGTITPDDFIALAHDLGVSVKIGEPMPFRAGASRCGASEPCSDFDLPMTWVVRPGATEIVPFRAGKARAGTTPLGEIVRRERLECLFNAIKPAWTKVVFDYSGA